MPLGTSIFLIAAGAILRYAVTAHISGISRPTLGLILMIVGAAGVLLSLLYMASARRRVVGRERVVGRGPYEEPR
jgi:divalent metal cation (Fe/Co/Zn/Cd) transporter